MYTRRPGSVRGPPANYYFTRARVCTRRIMYVIVVRGRLCVGHVQIECTYVNLSKTSVKSRESCRSGDNRWPRARPFWKIKNPNEENTMGLKPWWPRGRRKSDRKNGGSQRGHCTTTVFRVEVNEEITRLSRRRRLIIENGGCGFTRFRGQAVLRACNTFAVCKRFVSKTKMKTRCTGSGKFIEASGTKQYTS